MSGVIDCLNTRSSYSEGKRIVECLCASYAAEYGVPVKIARLTQVFGPGVSYSDNRVFAQFARSVIEKKNIILKTEGDTLRNYCYITDAIKALLVILLKGSSGEAYNIANMKTAISIAEMAQLVVDLFPESNSKVVFDIVDDIGKLGYNSTVKICLDSSKLQQLGWEAKIDLKEMFRKLVSSMKNEIFSSKGL